MNREQKLNPVVALFLWLFLLSFVGGGSIVIINYFVPFLHEEAFAVIALVLMGEIVILVVVGKSISVISAMGAARRKSADDSENSSFEE